MFEVSGFQLYDVALVNAAACGQLALAEPGIPEALLDELADMCNWWV
jgi:hypothetical protein